MANIEIWTDGSCNNATHNSGGYGIVLVNGIVRQFCGGCYINTTSARMEIMGIVKALAHCEPGDNVLIHSDNQYCVFALEKGWVFQWERNHFRGRKNTDLWKEFLKEYRRLNGKVTLKWVRGHDGNYYNELADQLAEQGAHKKKIIKDIRYN